MIDLNRSIALQLERTAALDLKIEALVGENQLNRLQGVERAGARLERKGILGPSGMSCRDKGYFHVDGLPTGPDRCCRPKRWRGGSSLRSFAQRGGALVPGRRPPRSLLSLNPDQRGTRIIRPIRPADRVAVQLPPWPPVIVLWPSVAKRWVPSYVRLLFAASWGLSHLGDAFRVKGCSTTLLRLIRWAYLPAHAHGWRLPPACSAPIGSLSESRDCRPSVFLKGPISRRPRARPWLSLKGRWTGCKEPDGLYGACRFERYCRNKRSTYALNQRGNGARTRRTFCPV